MFWEILREITPGELPQNFAAELFRPCALYHLPRAPFEPGATEKDENGLVGVPLYGDKNINTSQQPSYLHLSGRVHTMDGSVTSAGKYVREN